MWFRVPGQLFPSCLLQSALLFCHFLFPPGKFWWVGPQRRRRTRNLKSQTWITPYVAGERGLFKLLFCFYLFLWQLEMNLTVCKLPVQLHLAALQSNKKNHFHDMKWQQGKYESRDGLSLNCPKQTFDETYTCWPVSNVSFACSIESTLRRAFTRAAKKEWEECLDAAPQCTRVLHDRLKWISSLQALRGREIKTHITAVHGSFGNLYHLWRNKSKQMHSKVHLVSLLMTSYRQIMGCHTELLRGEKKKLKKFICAFCGTADGVQLFPAL